jgi:hypothetical protein
MYTITRGIDHQPESWSPVFRPPETAGLHKNAASVIVMDSTKHSARRASRATPVDLCLVFFGSIYKHDKHRGEC